MKGERVGEGGIGKVQVGGAAGLSVADSEVTSSRTSGRSLASPILRGQGKAESLRAAVTGVGPVSAQKTLCQLSWNLPISQTSKLRPVRVGDPALQLVAY